MSSHFHLYLREWREHRHLSQTVLAHRISSTASAISRIETGQRDFSGRMLFLLAVALDCHPADLFSPPPQRLIIFSEAPR